MRNKFDVSIEINICDKALFNDFEELGIEDTPTYYLYEGGDEDDWFPEISAVKLESTPESGDSYVNTEVVLLIGDSMARGRVIQRKIDTEGNSIGR